MSIVFSLYVYTHTSHNPFLLYVHTHTHTNTHTQHLASVGLDDHHTLNIWDWRRGKVMASTRGHSDRIFDVQFNPHSATELVTCGVKHIKFWTLCGNSLSGKKGLFGKKGIVPSVITVEPPYCRHPGDSIG